MAGARGAADRGGVRRGHGSGPADRAGVRETQQTLLSSVRDAQADAAAEGAERDALRSEVINLRRDQLEGDVAGQRLLRGLDDVSLAAATTEVTGPGLTVTLTDPGASRNLTDVSKERIPGSRHVVLDRDLQLVVNSLWAGGAEAIAVSGVRIGPNVTIRQAGAPSSSTTSPSAALTWSLQSGRRTRCGIFSTRVRGCGACGCLRPRMASPLRSALMTN